MHLQLKTMILDFKCMAGKVYDSTLQVYDSTVENAKIPQSNDMLLELKS
jgi:hypothetical protein